MKRGKKLIVFGVLILIITASVVFAYKEEIRETSQDLFIQYFQERIDGLPNNKFEEFKEQDVTTKLKKTLELQDNLIGRSDE